MAVITSQPKQQGLELQGKGDVGERGSVCTGQEGGEGSMLGCRGDNFVAGIDRQPKQQGLKLRGKRKALNAGERLQHGQSCIEKPFGMRAGCRLCRNSTGQERR